MVRFWTSTAARRGRYEAERNEKRQTTNDEREDRVNTLTVATSAGLLVVSNIFMTFAWYAHLKDLRARPLIVAILASWGIALFEYMLQVPANRIGNGVMNLSQLKIMQEVISLAVFVPFALLYMKQPIKLDFLWAGLCLVGAAYFIFRA
jgi:uncharacterized protein (DUF486 family)